MTFSLSKRGFVYLFFYIQDKLFLSYLPKVYLTFAAFDNLCFSETDMIDFLKG